MPIDDYRRATCRKCGHRYADYSPNCPRCGATSPKQFNVKVVGMIIALIAVGFVAFMFLGGFKLVPPGFLNQDENAFANNPVYVSKIVQQSLIDDRIILSAGSARTYQFTPAHAVETYVSGTITVQRGGPVELDFIDRTDHCIECGKLLTDKNIINFTAQGGNEYTVRLDNTANEDSALVNIELQILYKDPLNDSPQQVSVKAEDSSMFIPIENEEPANIDDPESVPVSFTITNASLSELRNYTLELINKDRADFGLSPVELSDNEAAQDHAEDVLGTRLISHWMTNGEKPYMTYTKHGGLSSVSQNVGTSGDASYYEDCTSGFYYCEKQNPREEINSHQYGMMYEDEECCDNGHRDNILDPMHTHVSLGIAYDDFTFVIVQNFENNYINFIQPITEDEQNIKIVGHLASNTKIYGITVYYDPLPTKSIYEMYKDYDSYGLGSSIAGVAPPGGYYEGIETLSASNWYESRNGSLIDIRFSIKDLTDDRGVYTIVTWLQDENGEPFMATNYAVTIE